MCVCMECQPLVWDPRSQGLCGGPAPVWGRHLEEVSVWLPAAGLVMQAGGSVCSVLLTLSEWHQAPALGVGPVTVVQHLELQQTSVFLSQRGAGSGSGSGCWRIRIREQEQDQAVGVVYVCMSALRICLYGVASHLYTFHIHVLCLHLSAGNISSALLLVVPGAWNCSILTSLGLLDLAWYFMPKISTWGALQFGNMSRSTWTAPVSKEGFQFTGTLTVLCY